VTGRPTAFKLASVGRSARAIDVVVTSAAIALVAAPLLRSNAPLDLVNHLWIVWAAGKTFIQAGHPAFFINTTTQGVFNPWFAFYGGTLYELTGAISELIGHPYVAFAGVTVAAIAGAYVGTLSLGRQFGLRGLIAHAPALSVVTSAYYITDLYGRGAWTEFIALSAIPPLVASGVYLVGAPRWRPWPVAVFAVSAVILSGSHNITLLWSVTMGVAVLLVMRLALGHPQGHVYRRLAMVAGLGVLAGLVNSWFLITDVVYARDVVASVTTTMPTGAVAAFDSASVLLDPFRTWPASSAFPSIYVQVPDWFLAWALAAGAMLLWHHQASRGLRRVWVGGLLLVAVLLAIIVDNAVWSDVPYPFSQLQFPFRLNGYLLLVIGGVVLAGALALQQARTFERRRRKLRNLQLSLIAVSVVSVGLCLWQQWEPSTSVPGYFVTRQSAFGSPNVLPSSWYAVDPYNDTRAPIVAVPAGRVLTINPSQVHGDRFAGWVDVPPGLEPIQTNIAGGDYVVQISGLRRLGRNAAGFTVVGRLKKGRGRVHIVVQTAATGAIVIGSILSILAILTLLAIVIYTTIRGRTTGRPTQADPSPSEA
jgi:uncharacterized integral membrane protein